MAPVEKEPPAIAADDPAEAFADPDCAMAFRLSVAANNIPTNQQVDLANGSLPIWSIAS